MSISNQGKATRPLPFPLRDPEGFSSTSEDGTITHETPDFFPDEETRIDIKLNLSLNEYVTLASAIDIGADIGWGNQRASVWWIWIRSLLGEASVSCEDIANCIETSEAVGTALNNYLSQSGHGTGNTPTTGTVYDADAQVLSPSQITDCDPDILFGAVTQLVDAVNTQLNSFFELLEAQSNGFERTAIIAEAVPGSDQAGFDTLAAGFDQALEEIAENYAAQFTPALRDEYRCDLFCLFKDTCDINFQALADYFFGRVGASIDTGEVWGDAIAWFVSGTWTGSQIVDAAFGLVFSAMAWATSVMNMDINWLIRGMASALNDPDPDWFTLCEECAPDLFEAVIGRICAIAGQDCGTVVSNPSMNVWRISSTHRSEGNDEGATIKDVSGRNFRITSATKVSGANITFNTHCTSAGSVVSSGGLSLNTDIKSVIYVAPNTQVWTYDFTIVLV